MQLASDTSSADGNCPFPTFLLLSLTHLTLVCLKHCTRRSFSCSEQKPRSEDLFVEVVELLCAVPQMILEILSHLVAVLSGTKLSEFGTRPSLLAPLDARFSARGRRKRVGKRFAGGLANRLQTSRRLALLKASCLTAVKRRSSVLWSVKQMSLETSNKSVRPLEQGD